MSNPPYENVKCPECGGEMVSRTGPYGVFWGCKSYPTCAGTRDSMGRSKADRAEYKRKKAEEENREFHEDLIDVPVESGEKISFNKKKT